MTPRDVVKWHPLRMYIEAWFVRSNPAMEEKNKRRNK
jgi:hypothetical protein